ncbi:hypothetical protein [Nocardiopsis deserti]|uniref:hypothetical protein n=1 Tax=Nocardiopsis deserti TaxID=2605988 RepID=UPI00123BBBF0|nr:hypothetical protein [Nocardiopsis deserti]
MTVKIVIGSNIETKAKDEMRKSMTSIMGETGLRRQEMVCEPLGVGYPSACAGNDLDLSHVLSPAASVSSLDLGSGLRSTFRVSPNGLERTPNTLVSLLGVHNPTSTQAEFTVTSCFPEVAASKAHLAFLGGSVETSGQSGADLRLLLEPGAHVWLTQIAAPTEEPLFSTTSVPRKDAYR